MSYAYNKERAKFKNTTPSMTDQSLAKETDMNVIVSRFQTTGMVRGAPNQPISGDFSRLPNNLRDLIHMGKRLTKLRLSLPKELENLSNEELMALTPEQLRVKLTPPAKQPDHNGANNGNGGTN